MDIVVTRKQARDIAETGKHCLLVQHVAREHYPIVNGWSNCYWFAVCTLTERGTLGHIVEGKVLQIHV